MTTDGTPQQRYRDLMSAFPTGVTVVTGLDAEGTPRGMTCTSITSVTLSPPTLLVCLRNGSGTLEAVAWTGGFAVNLLHEGGRSAAELFSGPDPHRFSRVRWTHSYFGFPWLIDDAFAVADCQVSGWHEVGDHTVVLGEISKITQIAGTPLLYGQRRFAAWPQPSITDHDRSIGGVAQIR